jgi:predicted MFS family arabinose efflux permease
VALYALEIGLDGAGPLFALFAIVVVAIRSLGAKIPDRLGAARTVRIALVALAAGLTTMGLWQEPVGLYVGTFVFSIGQALAFPAVMTLAMARTPAGDRGAVGGTVTAFVDVAIATGAIALGGVADLGGYSAVFLVSGAVAASGLVLLQRIATSGGLGEISAVPPGRAARSEDGVLSRARIASDTNAPCVLASERASHPDDERHSANPS